MKFGFLLIDSSEKPASVAFHFNPKSSKMASDSLVNISDEKVQPYGGESAFSQVEHNIVAGYLITAGKMEGTAAFHCGSSALTSTWRHDSQVFCSSSHPEMLCVQVMRLQFDSRVYAKKERKRVPMLQSEACCRWLIV